MPCAKEQLAPEEARSFPILQIGKTRLRGDSKVPGCCCVRKLDVSPAPRDARGNDMGGMVGEPLAALETQSQSPSWGKTKGARPSPIPSVRIRLEDKSLPPPFSGVLFFSLLSGLPSRYAPGLPSHGFIIVQTELPALGLDCSLGTGRREWGESSLPGLVSQ